MAEIEIEKNYTGVTLKADARLQVNILMQPVSYMTLFSSLPKIYMPMIWFHVHAEISPELASELRPLVLLGDMGPWALIAFSAFGILLIIIGLLLEIRKCERDALSKTLLPNDS